MTFRVGEPVICVKGVRGRYVLMKGARYTISAVEGEYVGVAEVPTDMDDTTPGHGQWFASRFRKLVTSTLEADTTAFLRIANSVDSIVRADLMERDMSEVEAELNRYDLP